MLWQAFLTEIELMDISYDHLRLIFRNNVITTFHVRWHEYLSFWSFLGQQRDNGTLYLAKLLFKTQLLGIYLDSFFNYKPVIQAQNYNTHNQHYRDFKRKVWSTFLMKQHVYCRRLKISISDTQLNSMHLIRTSVDRNAISLNKCVCATYRSDLG